MTECLPISRYYAQDKIKETQEDYLGELFDDIEYSHKNDGELELVQGTSTQ